MAVRITKQSADAFHNNMYQNAPRFDVNKARGDLKDLPDISQLKMNIERKYKFEQSPQSLKNKVQFGVGNVVGGILGSVGYLGEHGANPVSGTERAINYVKNYGKSMAGTIGRTSAPGMIYQSTKDTKKLIELVKNKDKKGLEAYYKGRTKENIQRIPEDISNVVDIIGLVSGAGAVKQGLSTVGKEVLESGVKGLVKTEAPRAPGFIINKLMNMSPKLGETVLKGVRGVTAPVRTTTAKMIGQIGLGAEKAGIMSEIAAKVRGGDSLEKVNQKIIPNGPTRTALELIWGGVTDVPYVAGALQKTSKSWNMAKVNAHRKAIYDEVFKVLGDTPEARKMLKTSQVMANGGKTNPLEYITEMMIREADKSGVDLGNMSPTMVKRFRNQFIEDGRWTEDNIFNIKHSELFAREGKVLGNLTPEALEESLNVARGKYTKLAKPGEKEMLALPSGKPTKGLGKVDVGSTGRVAGTPTEKLIGGKVEGVQQSGTLFDVKNVTTPKKNLNWIEQQIYNATQSKWGRKISTKVDTADLKNQTYSKIKSYLSENVGIKSDKVFRDLVNAVDAEKSKLIGSPDIGFLSNKTIKEVLRKNGILETKSNAVLKTIQTAINDTLKENDIFSLKQKLSTYAPVIKQADKVYTAARFKLRLGFHLMQQAETGLGAGMLAKDDMKYQTSKDILGKVMAHGTLGKSGKKIAGSVDAIQGIEKMQTGSQEAAKSAIARAAYFTDNLLDEVSKTPFAKEEMKRLGLTKVEDLPGIREYINGVKNSDDPVDFINKWIAGSRPTFEGGKIVGSKSQLELMIKASSDKAASKAVQIGEKIPLYKGLRSPWERQLHTVIFPYSYSKKFLGGGAKYLTTGKAIRPQLTYKMVKGYADMRDYLESQSDTSPRLKPIIYLMDVLNPVSTEYPLGFGGTTPFYKALDTLNTKRKYESGPRLINDTIKQLSPAVKEYEKLVGFGYNIAGKEEPKKLWGWMDTSSIYPQYREENKKRIKGKIKAFQPYYE